MLCFPPRRQLVGTDIRRNRFLFIAGDAGDVHEIRRVLRAAPADVCGLVVIEVCNPVQTVHIDAPEGVGVRWLFRENRLGTLAPRGDGLVAAADAWLDEWMRADENPADEYVIWLGCRTSSRVNDFARTLELELAGSASE